MRHQSGFGWLCCLGVALLASQSVLAASGQTLSTELRLLAGSPPSNTSEKGGVLMYPGTVIAPDNEKTRDECSSQALLGQLKSAYRLGELSVMSTERREVTLGHEEVLSGPAPGLDLRITLLAFDDETAAYQIRIRDGGKLLASPRVSVRRGSCGIVGGRDGDAAPYFFLVIGPSAARGAASPPDKPSVHLIHKVEPEYPVEAKDAGVQGLVILRCAIATDGSVRHIEVLKSAAPELSDAAKKAVGQWRYEPPKSSDGQPIGVEIDVTINFMLTED